MALKKPTFEKEPTDNDAAVTAVMDPPTEVMVVKGTAVGKSEPPAQAVDPVVAQEAAASAIAKASSTALAAGGAAEATKRFKREVEEMRGASDFSYGNYSMFKASQGKIGCKETNESFGRWVKVRLMSWDDHTEISPGETGASTKDFVAYSKDGKTVDSVIGEEQRTWVGKSVADYVNFLTADEGFEKTKSRRFIDTACAVLASDSGKGPIGDVVQITLSQSSIPAFAKHQQQLTDTARAVDMGLPGFTLPQDPFTFFFLCEAAAKGDNEWTKLRIVQQLPAGI